MSTDDSTHMIVCWRTDSKVNVDYNTFADKFNPVFGHKLKPSTTKKIVIRSIRILKRDARSKSMVVNKLADKRRQTAIWSIVKISPDKPPKEVNKIYYDKATENIVFDNEMYPAKTFNRIMTEQRGIDTLDIQRLIAGVVKPISTQPLRGNGGAYLVPIKEKTIIVQLIEALKDFNDSISLMVFEVKQILSEENDNG